MEEALRNGQMAQTDQRISEAIGRNYSGLRAFIRKRVADQSDAEDILQDVFYELVETYRMMKPIEQVTGWLFRVARNRITDLFRRKTKGAVASEPVLSEEGEDLRLEDLLPSPEAGPDVAYARTLLVDALDEALEELPPEQREVFIAHELMGYSFKELSEQSGIPVNTLLSRKHYAVLHLRDRLHSFYEEFLTR